MRIAYLMASNGPKNFGTMRTLKYALEDANRIQKRFESQLCGFEVYTPKEGLAPKDVVYELETLCEKCSVGDTMLCYFSGHGILDNNGNLVLLWDDSSPDKLLTSAIRIDKIMNALQGCKAKNKLLLLDCCHAGAVAQLSGFKGTGEVILSDHIIPPDNYAVLVAAGRTDRARELMEHQGGFFTSSICLALSNEMVRADKDKDGRISLADLTAWVQECAAQHNQENPDDVVPYPSILGKFRGDFYLTATVQDWEPYEIP